MIDEKRLAEIEDHLREHHDVGCGTRCDDPYCSCYCSTVCELIAEVRRLQEALSRAAVAMKTICPDCHHDVSRHENKRSGWRCTASLAAALGETDMMCGCESMFPCLVCGEPGVLVPKSVGAFSMGYALCVQCRHIGEKRSLR